MQQNCHFGPEPPAVQYFGGVVYPGMTESIGIPLLGQLVEGKNATELRQFGYTN
jgi:hypothetical protein